MCAYWLAVKVLLTTRHKSHKSITLSSANFGFHIRKCSYLLKCLDKWCVGSSPGTKKGNHLTTIVQIITAEYFSCCFVSSSKFFYCPSWQYPPPSSSTSHCLLKCALLFLLAATKQQTSVSHSRLGWLPSNRPAFIILG